MLGLLFEALLFCCMVVLPRDATPDRSKTWTSIALPLLSRLVEFEEPWREKRVWETSRRLGGWFAVMVPEFVLLFGGTTVFRAVEGVGLLIKCAPMEVVVAPKDCYLYRFVFEFVVV